jgi:WD40 repeat protein
MIYLYPISSLLGTDPHEYKYTKGIASNDVNIFLGTSSGKVIVFDCSGGLSGSSFNVQQKLDSEPVAISAVSSSAHYVAAANDVGSVFLYRIREGFLQTANFGGDGSPCTCLAQSDYVVAAGFSSGHIRLFRSDIGELVAEIAAHARIVTGLDYQPSTNFLASCSMDQHVHVWSLPTFLDKASSSVDCVFTDILENQIATGVSFLQNNRLAVSTYDEEDVVVYHQ